jgi:hypothetical protein
VSRALSRKSRGMATQALLAARWVANELFPWATDAGAGRQGNDILNTPGLAVEVKARDDVSLVAALGQAMRGNPESLPIVVWRHNGQGVSSMDDWTVTMRLADFELLWRQSR